MFRCQLGVNNVEPNFGSGFSGQPEVDVELKCKFEISILFMSCLGFGIEVKVGMSDVEPDSVQNENENPKSEIRLSKCFRCQHEISTCTNNIELEIENRFSIFVMTKIFSIQTSEQNFTLS